LEAAEPELPVGRIAGSLAGNHTPPDRPAWMLHLEPGKISGRGAAQGLDPTAQMPRRASPARRHHARARRLARPDPGPVPATMLLAPLDLRPGSRWSARSSGAAACRSRFRANIVPAVPGCTGDGRPAQPAAWSSRAFRRQESRRTSQPRCGRARSEARYAQNRGIWLLVSRPVTRLATAPVRR
jgi:hypothetical protein